VSEVGVERYYTTAQLAELLCVHPETIRRAAGRGELRFVRVGRDYRFSESAVHEWLQARAA
jgi:excisionase family DNA binding protein